MSFNEKMKDKLSALRNVLDIIRGKENYKKKIEVLTNPTNPQTSSRLTKPQILFVASSYWASQTYPELESFKGLSRQLCLTQISKDGLGIKETIALQKAMTHGETVTTKETVKESLAKKIGVKSSRDDIS